MHCCPTPLSRALPTSHTRPRCLHTTTPTQRNRFQIPHDWLEIKRKARHADPIPCEPLPDNAPMPPRVTRLFFNEHHAFTHAFDNRYHQPSALRDLASHIQTPADAALFKESARNWRASRDPVGKVDSDVALTSLMSVRAYAVLLDMLCERHIYGLLPSHDQLSAIMSALADEALEAGDAGDEAAHISALDNMYKLFAVLIHYDVPPTSETYSRLIVAGVRGRTSEGWRRSEVTGREQVSLGLALDADGAGALAIGYARAGEGDTALAALERLVDVEAGGVGSVSWPLEVVKEMGKLEGLVAGNETLKKRFVDAIERSRKTGGFVAKNPLAAE
ncbi:hypothetical protein HDV00_003324 [Rhizophlyctis rosea]|nr:hypothetical protein HDV00_003324 [Rhizophlyctis rosea]